MNMRRLKRTQYARNIAVLCMQSFFGGMFFLHPGVYRRPLSRIAKPDRVQPKE